MLIKFTVFYFTESGIQQWHLDSDSTHPSRQKKEELENLQNVPKIKVVKFQMLLDAMIIIIKTKNKLL